MLSASMAAPETSHHHQQASHGPIDGPTATLYHSPVQVYAARVNLQAYGTELAHFVFAYLQRMRDTLITTCGATYPGHSALYMPLM